MDVTAETAADHVRLVEQRLRALLARELMRSYGARWHEKVSKAVRTKLEVIRQNELKARSHAPEEPHLLGYAGFDHLTWKIRER